MQLRIFLTGLIVVGLISCQKPEPIQEKATYTFTRTLVFPNQNNLVKQAVYFNEPVIEAAAHVEDNKLQMYFLASPKTNGTAGDGIVLYIPADKLQSGTTLTFRFNDNIFPISFCRYTYSFMTTSGGIWGSISDSNMGVQFEGTLTISSYNATRKIITGEYNIEAKGLINDPTMQNGGTVIDPVNQCDLRIAGNFKNLQVQ